MVELLFKAHEFFMNQLHLNRFIMQLLFGCIFLSFNDLSRAQGLNRIYGNAAFGYSHHKEAGLYVHFLDHFSAGIGTGTTKVKTGPSYYTPSSTGLFGTNRRLKDTYICNQFFLGITTHTMDRVDMHLMAGPSWVNATILSDFELKENEYSHAEWVEYTANEYKTVGFVLRGEVLIEFSKFAGLNLSVQQNWNNIRDEFSVIVGFNIGLVQDRYY